MVFVSSPTSSRSVSARLSAALERVIALRENFEAHPQLAVPWKQVKRWQSARLRSTYLDLFSQPRYRLAGEFFLSEIYGDKDFSQRDREALRVVPKLARMLTDRAVETLLLAVELDELSEQLDARVAGCVVLPVTEDSYAAAYVAAGTLDERRAQIDHVERIGRALEKLARLPLLTGMLHLMRAPAEAAGLSHLHSFLQSGFDAFKAMGPAGEFLATIAARETHLMERLFAGDPQPLRDLTPLTGPPSELLATG